MASEPIESDAAEELPPLADSLRLDLFTLLGFHPDPVALHHVRAVVAARGWREEPYLLAAMLCAVWSIGPDAWRERGIAYARRGGYEPAAFGLSEGRC